MRTPLLSLLLAPLAALAQPVIQYANIDLIGNTYPVHVVTDPGSSDPNIDGANVTWDFSSATLALNQGTISFVDPAGTPYAASYPTSNLVQVATTGPNTYYTYFALSPTQLDMLAQDLGSADPSIYTDPKTPLIFPFAYQDYFIDYYTENGTDYSVSRAYMGYGTLILPTGTYTNVVKMASTSGSIDFFGSDPIQQLVTIDSDGEAIVVGDATIGLNEQGTAPVLRAYPNPVTDRVEVTGLRSSGTWTLLDAEGRALRTGRHSAGPLTIDMAALSAGCYMVQFQGSAPSRVKVIKE